MIRMFSGLRKKIGREEKGLRRMTGVNDGFGFFFFQEVIKEDIFSYFDRILEIS